MISRYRHCADHRADTVVQIVAKVSDTSFLLDPNNLIEMTHTFQVW